MKKIIFGFAVAAAAIFGGYTANQTGEMAMSGLQVDNVEALAVGEWNGCNNHWETVYVGRDYFPGTGNECRVEIMVCKPEGDKCCVAGDSKKAYSGLG